MIYQEQLLSIKIKWGWIRQINREKSEKIIRENRKSAKPTMDERKKKNNNRSATKLVTTTFSAPPASRRTTTTLATLSTAAWQQHCTLRPLISPLLPAFILVVGLTLCIQTAEATPPSHQLLRMYTPNALNNVDNPVLNQIVASSKRRTPHVALLSRKLRELGSRILAEEGAKIRQFEEQHEGRTETKMRKRADEFGIGMDTPHRDLLMNKLNGAETQRQRQKEQLMGSEEEEDDDDAVLKVAAAVGLLRQERNEPNVAAQKLLRLNELGGTMFRFG